MLPPVTEHVSLHSKSYVKIFHVRMGVANNMHPLNWGGGAQTEKIQFFHMCWGGVTSEPRKNMTGACEGSSTGCEMCLTSNTCPFCNKSFIFITADIILVVKSSRLRNFNPSTLKNGISFCVGGTQSSQNRPQ